MKQSFIKLITCAALFSNLMVPIMAQDKTNPSNFVVPTAAQSTDYSSSTPIFGIDLTSCLSVFNWQDFTDDLRAGRNSSPFDDKGCVTQKDVTTNGTRTLSGNNATYNVGNSAVKVAKYKDFAIGTPATKTVFGEMPVLGIFPNGANTAQNISTFNLNASVKTAGTTNDRSQVANLPTIFSSKILSEIYSTGGAKTGTPRIPFSGENVFVKGTNGEPTFMGGWCKVENGKISVRTKFEGTYEGKPFTQNVNPADYGIDVNNPAKACAWSDAYKTEPKDYPLWDNGFTKDTNLQAYQFVYTVPFAKTLAECNSWFPGAFKDYDTCLNWFRTKYGTLLAGNKTTGTSLNYVLTYYGAFDDKYTGFRGWTNPDIAGPRVNYEINSTLEEIVAFGGHDEKSIRQAFNDTTTSYSTLVGRLESAPAATKDTYRKLLSARWEGVVRGANGFSTYIQ